MTRLLSLKNSVNNLKPFALTVTLSTLGASVETRVCWGKFVYSKFSLNSATKGLENLVKNQIDAAINKKTKNDRNF
jgi:hypothetical protein